MAMPPHRLPSARQFFPAVNDNDAMKKTIRIHTLIERALIRHIRKALPHPEAIDLKPLPFLAKVDLAIALGQLRADVRGSLSAVNTVRNKYAHEPATRLTAKMTTDLWNTLPVRLQDELHAIFRRRFSKQPKSMLTQVLGILFLDARDYAILVRPSLEKK
ncbi:MAG: hypothetical protein Q8N47_25265 [Bryobacterales bacterium]|nr:hypothetical protein [Bryobacterales bacterium]